MKRSIWLLLVFALVFCAAPNAHADEKYAIGADVAVKVQYFHFTNSNLGDAKAQDGVFVGVEAYKELFFPNFYLGVETGWAGPSGTFTNTIGGRFTVSLKTDIDYVPIEFNAKYVIPIAPNFTASLGAGPSINYMKVEETLSAVSATLNLPSFNFHNSQWLWGGQFFGELNYRCQNWFIGASVKYQLTEEKDFSLVPGGRGPLFRASGDNLRAGAQIGFLF